MTDNELFGNSEQLNDTISRQAAIKAADSIIERDTSGNNDVVRAMTAWKEYIKALPTVDAVPVVHGQWIDKDGGIATCSVCGDRWGVWSVMKYCPNCGAKMDGKDGEGND